MRETANYAVYQLFNYVGGMLIISAFHIVFILAIITLLKLVSWVKGTGWQL